MKTFGSHTGARGTDPLRLKKTLMGIFISNVTDIFGIRQIKKFLQLCHSPKGPSGLRVVTTKKYQKIVMDTESLRNWGEDFHGDKEKYSPSRRRGTSATMNTQQTSGGSKINNNEFPFIKKNPTEPT